MEEEPQLSGTNPHSTVWLPRLLAIASVSLAAIVQGPAVGRYFAADDFLHLYQIAVQGFASFLFQPHGGHVLIPSNLAFYLCHALFGLDAWGYYGLAVLTHLANVALLFAVILGFTRRPFFAALGASAFGMSPAAVGSVGLFSAYGHVLATHFFLWVLRDVANRWRSRDPVPPRLTARWIALLLAGGTSFGVGLPVSMIFGAVLWVLLPRAPNRTRVALSVGSLSLVMPLLFAAVHVSRGEDGVGFVADRLGDGLDLVTGTASMTFQLFANGLAGLVLGPWLAHDASGFTFGPMRGRALAEGLPVAVVVLLLFCAALAVAWWRASPERRGQILGMGAIAAAGYAVIAVGRADFYASQDVSLALAVSPLRYHYCGPMAISVVLCLMLGRESGGDEAEGSAGREGSVLYGAWLLASVAFYVMASPAAPGPEDGAARAEHRRALDRIDRAVRARPLGATVFLRNARFNAGPPFGGFPGHAGIFVISFPDNRARGRQVRFIERDPLVRRAALAHANARVRELIVARRPQKFPPANRD
ncbi:MAG: hypothetical protein HRU01_09525 [Myxococcales bacterium]|nr:hypothetical protein [Myxococcales bacterium]